MAYLALDITQVLCVLGIIGSICPDVIMAVFTFSGIGIIVPGRSNSIAPMESIVVTFRTDHTLLRPVNITWDPFIQSQVLIADSRAMTSNAVVLGRWRFSYLVA